MEISSEQYLKQKNSDITAWSTSFEADTNVLYSWDPVSFPHFSRAVFDSKNKSTLNTSSGRGAIIKFFNGGEAYIARHFYRGGWVKIFSSDSYLLYPGSITRVEREVQLLQELRKLKLPVPAPAAYKIQRKGFFCSMDIILKEIPGVSNLVDFLYKEKLEMSTWRNIGETISRFHQNNVCHSDLNAHNILLDNNGKVWLIDFDKSCVSRGLSVIWKQQNLLRLKRSLNKESKKNSGFTWSHSEWNTLLEGYNQNTN